MCCEQYLFMAIDAIDATLFASGDKQSSHFRFLPLWTEDALPKQMNGDMFLWQKNIISVQAAYFQNNKAYFLFHCKVDPYFWDNSRAYFRELAYFHATETISLQGTDICTEKWPSWPCISTKTICHLPFKVDNNCGDFYQELELNRCTGTKPDWVRGKVGTIKSLEKLLVEATLHADTMTSRGAVTFSRS